MALEPGSLHTPKIYNSELPASSGPVGETVPSLEPSSKQTSQGKQIVPGTVAKASAVAAATGSAIPSESEKVPQAEQVLYPSSDQTLTIDDIEKRFKVVNRRGGDFTGRWIPHYSDSDKQVVVTRCTGPGTYETLKEITVNGKNKNLSQAPYKEVIEAFGIDKYYDQVGRFGGHSYTDPFTAPKMPFTPRLSIVLKGEKAFEEFQSKWNAAGLGDSVRVCFDKLNNRVYLPYTDRELVALSNQHPFLDAPIGKSMMGKLDLQHSDTIGHLRAVEDLPTLLKKANAFFETLNPTLVEVDLPVDDPAQMVIQLLEDKKFPGVLIGEGHSDTNPKAMLIENMKAFKDSGVKTLFLEHLRVDTLQPDLDRYFSEGPEAKMPSMLKAYLDELDRGFRIGKDNPSGFTALVKAAHDNGIRIVGIDTSASYAAGDSAFGATGPDRIKAMNYAANRVIAEEAKDEKYVALVGSMHVSTSQKVPGLSEILGCPNIVFITDNKESIESGVKDLLPQGPDDQGREIKGGNINFLVKKPKSK